MTESREEIEVTQVFVILRHEYGESKVVGAFSDEEDAAEKVDELNEENDGYTYSYSETYLDYMESE